MTDSELREMLEAGLHADFWQWFVDQVQQEWGPHGVRYQQELDQALNLTDNDAAASQARQVRSGQKVILMLLRVPAETLARLKTVPAVLPPGSGPRDDALLTGQSRRGGL